MQARQLFLGTQIAADKGVERRLERDREQGKYVVFGFHAAMTLYGDDAGGLMAGGKCIQPVMTYFFPAVTTAPAWA